MTSAIAHRSSTRKMGRSRSGGSIILTSQRRHYVDEEEYDTLSETSSSSEGSLPFNVKVRPERQKRTKAAIEKEYKKIQREKARAEKAKTTLVPKREIGRSVSKSSLMKQWKKEMMVNSVAANQVITRRKMGRSISGTFLGKKMESEDWQQRLLYEQMEEEKFAKKYDRQIRLAELSLEDDRPAKHSGKQRSRSCPRGRKPASKGAKKLIRDYGPPKVAASHEPEEYYEEEPQHQEYTTNHKESKKWTILLPKYGAPRMANTKKTLAAIQRQQDMLRARSAPRDGERRRGRQAMRYIDEAPRRRGRSSPRMTITKASPKEDGRMLDLSQMDGPPRRSTTDLGRRTKADPPSLPRQMGPTRRETLKKSLARKEDQSHSHSTISSVTESAYSMATPKSSAKDGSSSGSSGERGSNSRSANDNKQRRKPVAVSNVDPLDSNYWLPYRPPRGLSTCLKSDDFSMPEGSKFTVLFVESQNKAHDPPRKLSPFLAKYKEDYWWPRDIIKRNKKVAHKDLPPPVHSYDEATTKSYKKLTKNMTKIDQRQKKMTLESALGLLSSDISLGLERGHRGLELGGVLKRKARARKILRAVVHFYDTKLQDVDNSRKAEALRSFCEERTETDRRWAYVMALGDVTAVE